MFCDVGRCCFQEGGGYGLDLGGGVGRAGKDRILDVFLNSLSAWVSFII